MPHSINTYFQFFGFIRFVLCQRPIALQATALARRPLVCFPAVIEILDNTVRYGLILFFELNDLEHAQLIMAYWILYGGDQPRRPPR